MAATAAPSFQHLEADPKAQPVHTYSDTTDTLDSLRILSSRPDLAHLSLSSNRAVLPPRPGTSSSLTGGYTDSEATLDDDPSGPFEGPEKLLELWFVPDDDPSLLPPTAARERFSIRRTGLEADANGESSNSGPHRTGLRAVRRDVWERALDLVKCKVLSVIEGPQVDAYLLSESSMFVFPHKLILKTCGTTTLLLGLERLLEIAWSAIYGLTRGPPAAASPPPKPSSSLSNSFSDPDTAPSSEHSRQRTRALGSIAQRVFYSRKSFMFPERQKGPHRDWMLEVGVLDAFFDQGSAYTVGKMNGDHWLLYMSTPADVPSLPAPTDALLASAAEAADMLIPSTSTAPLCLPGPFVDSAASDQTLEILMTHLSPRSCKHFFFEEAAAAAQGGDAGDGVTSQAEEGSAAAQTPPSKWQGHALGATLSSELGLLSLFPSAQLDAFAFEPCGYSANAVVGPSGKRARQQEGANTATAATEGRGTIAHTNAEAEAGAGGYWTVHVTPEEGSSYASFETNIPLRPAACGVVARSSPDVVNVDKSGPGHYATAHTLPSLLARVVSIFEPGKLSVTLFVSSDPVLCSDASSQALAAAAATKAAPNAYATQPEVLRTLQLEGYVRTDRIAYEFGAYDLVFVSFEKR